MARRFGHRLVPKHSMVKVLFSLLLGAVVSFCVSQVTRYFVVSIVPRCLGNFRPRFTTRADNLGQEIPTKRFLFVAVMTSEAFMDTRARGVWDTWGRSVPGKLIFFIGQTNHTDWNDMPVIQLDVEDNIYPPQRKSFTMLKYIYNNFLDRYKWFVRSDDDVYMRLDRLRVYLKSFDSSTDIVVGQPGVGKKRELGSLGLAGNDNFCIGGTGIIMTSSVLRKIGPHLFYCLNRTASFHEDVEVGRCIRSFSGVICPWGYEGKEFFYQEFGDPSQAYHGSLDTEEFDKSINFHPVKDPTYMRRIHAHFTSSHIKYLLWKREKLSRLLENMRTILEGRRVRRHSLSNGQLPSHTRDISQRYFRNSLQPWEMFDFSKVWSLDHNSPFRYIDDGTKVATTDMLHHSKEAVLRVAESERYLAVNFDTEHTGYMRTDPKLGVEAIVTLGAKYQVRNDAGKMNTSRARLSVRLRRSFGILESRSRDTSDSAKTTIHFIVPLMERLECFRDLFKSFASVFLSRKDPVKLLVVYFRDVASAIGRDEQKILFRSYADRYPSVELNWLDVRGPFKRAVVLKAATDYYHGNDSLLFFCDVDLVLHREFADRCRANAVVGKRVYFPVMFSQFNPAITYAVRKHPGANYPYGKEAGLWRFDAFGLLCAYTRDINALHTDVLGGGLDDVDLYEKFVKRGDIEIFRAPDPGLVHVYHPGAPRDKTGQRQATCRAAAADIREL